MSLYVMKFGGTSVGTLDRIRAVADRVIRTKDQGHDVVVVVSAMAGETDRLVALAHSITKMPDQREYDVLVSTGEQVSIALLAMELKQRGYGATSFLGHQVTILTDAAYSKARIKEIRAPRLLEALKRGEIGVLAGFQGIDDNGNITTLGRGGSDTTAVAVAAAIYADVCEIYTDVDGIYTTDPNVCPTARKLSRISYEEMLELASLGAKVLQPRSVEFAMKYNVPIHVRTSFSDVEGSWVTKEVPEMEAVLVSGIAYDRNEAKVSLIGVSDTPGIAAKIFSTLADANICVDMIIQNISAEGRTDLTFTVPKADLTRAVHLIEGIKDIVGAREVKTSTDIAKISMVGVGMRSHSGVAARMFETLANAKINIEMISTSEIKVSCIINARYLELAVRELHDSFGLDRDQVAEENSFARAG